MISSENKQNVIENEEAMREIIGKGADAYIEKWSKFPEKKMYMGCNFAALFLGATWLAYRKMYKLTAIIMISFAAFIGLLNYSMNSKLFGNMDLFMITISLILLKFIPIAVCLYLFVFGNGIYYRKVSKLVSENSNNLGSELTKNKIGGTSLIAAISVMALTMIYFISFILIVLSPFVSNY